MSLKIGDGVGDSALASQAFAASAAWPLLNAADAGHLSLPALTSRRVLLIAQDNPGSVVAGRLKLT